MIQSLILNLFNKENKKSSSAKHRDEIHLFDDDYN